MKKAQNFTPEKTTPRDWLDHEGKQQSWLMSNCKQCKKGFRGPFEKVVCYVCATPTFPLGVRHIRSCAVLFGDKVWQLPAPARHADIVRYIKKVTGDGLMGPDTKGFIDSEGVFISRGEAAVVAKRAGQLLPGVTIASGQLYSEDLW